MLPSLNNGSLLKRLYSRAGARIISSVSCSRFKDGVVDGEFEEVHPVEGRRGIIDSRRTGQVTIIGPLIQLVPTAVDGEIPRIHCYNEIG